MDDKNALIGHTGFVGSTLLRQTDSFGARFRSTDIATIRGRAFDLVVCAGAPAQKWKANREPERDREIIRGLMDHLATIRAERFVLVSTVDVYPAPAAVNEETAIDESRLQPYGLHRRQLERFVADHFPRHLIVRLPGLVGPGLRKNVLFDFRYGNNLQAIDSRAVFQFYPMVNLWPDLQRAMALGLELANVTAEPISVAEVAREAFGLDFHQELEGPPPRYDLRSRHADVMGGAGHYQYCKRETLLAIRAYAQSEPALPVARP